MTVRDGSSISKTLLLRFKSIYSFLCDISTFLYFKDFSLKIIDIPFILSEMHIQQKSLFSKMYPFLVKSIKINIICHAVYFIADTPETVTWTVLILCEFFYSWFILFVLFLNIVLYFCNTNFYSYLKIYLLPITLKVLNDL